MKRIEKIALNIIRENAKDLGDNHRVFTSEELQEFKKLADAFVEGFKYAEAFILSNMKALIEEDVPYNGNYRTRFPDNPS